MKKTKSPINQNKPLRGEKLAKAVVNQILNLPETWNQLVWHSGCGTKHCFAGWCQILGGRQMDESSAKSDARELLEISEGEACFLFRSDCSLVELYHFAKNYSAGFDRDGFDRDGRDRDGFDRAGFDRAGFDRAGRDRDGFDRDGFDRDGRDRDGNKLPLFEL